MNVRKIPITTTAIAAAYVDTENVSIQLDLINVYVNEAFNLIIMENVSVRY